MVRVSCLCGRVLIEAELPSERIGICHCNNCRRAHGAGSWTWATFPLARVRVTAGEDDLIGYSCDVGSTRRFCRVCGSTLLYESPRWPGLLDLSVANMLDPLDAKPDRHTYADRAPDWDPILDDLPRLGGESGVEPLT